MATAKPVGSTSSNRAATTSAPRIGIVPARAGELAFFVILTLWTKMGATGLKGVCRTTYGDLDRVLDRRFPREEFGCEA